MMVDAAAKLEGKSYEYEIVGLLSGDSVDVGEGYRVEAFATDHVVASLGYHLIRSVERLREEFASRRGPELADLRKAGVSIARREDRLELSYSGDTAWSLDHN